VTGFATPSFTFFLAFPRSSVGMPSVTLQRHATPERCWMNSRVGAWELGGSCGGYFFRVT